MTMLRWMQEIRQFLPVKPQFALWGNIYDVYPFGGEGDKPRFTLKLQDFLRNSLKQVAEFHLFLEFSPLTGITLLEGDPELFKSITGETITAEKPLAITLKKAPEVITKLVQSREAHVAVFMSLASRYRQIEREEILNEFYFRMFSLAHATAPKLLEGKGETCPRFSPVFWILDRENEMPDWYCINNMRVRSIGIPKPDNATRKMIVQGIAKHLPGFAESSPKSQAANINLFVDQTNNMFATEIISIVQLAKSEGIPFEKVGDAIRRYRVGVIENPWTKLDVAKIRNAQNLLRERVKGQPEAIGKVADVIRRAILSLSGSQYSAQSMRPKGVLFFAGPTGVGKTELAKAITELLFGSEGNYLRFDMSEFSQEHSDQRLIGAPPGYVGYDMGGELTNAVRQTPFSVILFDEIEKANQKILDIFLQILDDGRLTSGRGETVFFTESLILFTSNLGIYETLADGTKVQRARPDLPFESTKREVLGAIEEFFKYKLCRPEILNRIGDNIIVFDFIRPEIARQILARMVGNVVTKIHETLKIELIVPQEALDQLAIACTSDLTMGGRGVGNKLESVLVNPLASQLFGADIPEGSSVTLVVPEPGIIQLKR